MRFGVIVFPGTNCDMDAYHVLDQVLCQEVRYVWHGERSLAGLDAVVLPGGFAYGDYLRTGAIARFSPVMDAVAAFAEADGLVIGICNGFQILCEAGLLPGALMQNSHLQFRCQWVHLRVENAATPFTTACHSGQVLAMPIAHFEGNYYADDATLAELNARGQILLRYCMPTGEVTDAANPNGSLQNIAGIVNRRGNVFGLMPHPERACEAILGGTDGRLIFESMLRSGVSAVSGDIVAT